MRSKFKWIYTLLVALTMQFSFAQEKTITGIVSDASGALPGVNVVVKGTQRGVSTGFDGSYSIKAKEGETLVYSFMGMREISKVVGSSNVINTFLQDDTQKIGEVVVTGAVGIKKKSNAVTASYSQINNTELKAAGNPDPVRALVGKVSGVTINSTANGVNGGNSIRVRSMLSVGGNTEALVVIDDVISTADVFAQLPADAIQNVNILKGAQGAALYGSQGKQGVVIVTTKKGSKNDKFTVSLNSSVDLEQISFLPEMQQKYGQGWYGAWDQYENGGWGELFDGSTRPIGLVQPDGTYIEGAYSPIKDNVKGYYKDGTIFQNSVNINAGGADSSVNLNIGNLKRNFIVDGDDLNRNSILLNASKKIGRLTVGGTFNYNGTRSKQSNTLTTLQSLLQAASNVPIEKYDNGTPNGWTVYYQNPFWTRDHNRLEETSNFFNTGVNLGYDITKNINITYNGTLQQRNTNQVSYGDEVGNPAEADAFGADISQGSYFFQSNFNSLYHYGDLMLNFKYDLTDNVGMKLNLGQNIQYGNNNRVSQGGNNLQIPGWYNVLNVLNPSLPGNLRNTRTDSRSTATFLNADFNYSDYLFLNATARYEGNSVALPGDQFYFYPSVGVSFIPTNAFASLKDKQTLSNLKVFANYTKVGSLDPINPYDVLDRGSVPNGFPFPDTGNSFTAPRNPTRNIRPEMYTTIEAGANFGFFNDRLTLDAAYYLTKVDDLITRASRPAPTGLVSEQANLGNLEGKGFEIDLGFMPVKTDNFKWSGRASFTSNETKVIDAGESNKIDIYDISAVSNINAQIVALEGYSFPYIMGTDWQKDSQGRIIVDAEGRPGVNPQFLPLGKATPDYIIGLTNTFNYKGIGLTFTGDYRTGHSFISETKYELTWSGKLVESADFDRNVGFVLPNSSIADPSNPGQYIDNTSVLTGGFYTASGNANRTQAYYGLASGVGSHNLVDATALKIREIALSYDFPKKVLEKMGVEALKINVNARNPFIFLADDNKGYSDPEASSQFNGSNRNAASTALGNTSRNGLGYSQIEQYPSTRTFGFGVNVTF